MDSKDKKKKKEKEELLKNNQMDAPALREVIEFTDGECELLKDITSKNVVRK